jgi:hypothetical protein
MTDKELPKAPAPAVVERAQEKIAEGAELNQREEKALADQAEIDRARGYTEVDWNGQKLFQSLVTGHTTATEYEMVQYHAGLHHANITAS